MKIYNMKIVMHQRYIKCVFIITLLVTISGCNCNGRCVINNGNSKNINISNIEIDTSNDVIEYYKLSMNVYVSMQETGGRGDDKLLKKWHDIEARLITRGWLVQYESSIIPIDTIGKMFLVEATQALIPEIGVFIVNANTQLEMTDGARRLGRLRSLTTSKGKEMLLHIERRLIAKHEVHEAQ